jgi:hypothetical protein
MKLWPWAPGDTAPARRNGPSIRVLLRRGGVGNEGLEQIAEGSGGGDLTGT